MKLKIAEDLSLPLDVVTQKLGWIGTTGSGKTYGASKLAELLWDAHAHFIVLDPVGVWYGLRLAKDGKKPSDITIPIFGGLHGDVPLEATAGAMMADLLVDRALTAILDVSQFESDAQKARFAADFGDRFFFRKKASPSAVHLFIEECQEFVPENHQRGEERMKHVFVRMQKIGRNFGIGTSYITQRPQEVSKKALNLAQTLFVFRTTGTHEREAINRWIKDKSIEGQDIASELPKLKTGAPHVWSPEWLNLSSVAHILEKRTFNASATPEVGTAAKSRELAPIDLEKIRTEMAATIEKAKADDPRELKKINADLRAQLAKAVGQVNTKTEPIRQGKRVEALTEKDREILRTMSDRIHALEVFLNAEAEAIIEKVRVKVASAINTATGDMLRLLSRGEDEAADRLRQVGFQKVLGKLATVDPQPTSQKTAGQIIPASINSTARYKNQVRNPPPVVGDGEVKLNRLAERKILQVLSQHGPRSMQQLAIQAGYAASGGGFRGAVSKLRTLGLIVSNGNGNLHITDSGQGAIGDVDPLPTGRALIDYWMQQFNRLAEREVLRVVVEAYPQAISMEDIARRTQPPYEPEGGGFRGAVSKLRTLGLIEGRGEVRASEDLFA